MDLTPAEQLAVTWLIWLRDVRKSPEGTWKKYGLRLAKWLRWCEERGQDPLRPELVELERFVTRVRSNGLVGAPSTQKGDVACLSSWYGWMVKRRYVAEDPTLDLMAPAVKRTPGRPILAEHWPAIWAVAPDNRARARLGLGYYAALRPAEIKSARIMGDDVLTKRKGGETHRVPWLYMARLVADRLPHLLPDLDVLVEAMRNPWDGENVPVGKLLARACARAGVPHYTAHQLRHACITNLLGPEIRMPLEMAGDLTNHHNLDELRSYVPSGSTRLLDFYPELRTPLPSPRP